MADIRAPLAQLPLAFSDTDTRLFALASAQTKSPASKPPAGRARRPKPAAGPMPDLPAIACLLEQHPDYRVLRRLQPQLHYPGRPVGQTRRVLVLDTETTGLNHGQDKIIELALLRLELDLASGLPVGDVSVYDGLEDPGRPLSEDVRQITGLTDDTLKGQRLDDARVAELLAGADLVLAHNAAFDRPFCEARYPGFAAIDWACSLSDIDWRKEGRGSGKLEHLALEQGVFYQAHRAEIDCHALLAVLCATLASDGQTGLARLLAAAAVPSYRLLATQAPFEAKDALKARGYRWDGERRVWHTRLSDRAQLETECAWLKAHVFVGKQARVHLETLDSRLKYSGRPGALSERQL